MTSEVASVPVFSRRFESPDLQVKRGVATKVRGYSPTWRMSLMFTRAVLQLLKTVFFSYGPDFIRVGTPRSSIDIGITWTEPNCSISSRNVSARPTSRMTMSSVVMRSRANRATSWDVIAAKLVAVGGQVVIAQVEHADVGETGGQVRGRFDGQREASDQECFDFFQFVLRDPLLPKPLDFIEDKGDGFGRHFGRVSVNA